MKQTVVIVGGGITGLVAAYSLERETDYRIVLLEASDRVGGKIATDRVAFDGGDFVVERGPDSLFTRKPWAIELAEELGLGEQLIAPARNEFSMLIDGKLHAVPRGLLNLNRLERAAVAEATFLSQEAKGRAMEPRPSGRTGSDDISIGEFFRSRFGDEYSRLVIEPLLAGTHGGDPMRLSMRALYPEYLDSDRIAALPTGKPTFVSLEGGLGTLVGAVERSLRRTEVELAARVTGVAHAHEDSRYSAKRLRVVASGGREWLADHVVVATPSRAASRFLAEQFAAESELLAELRFSSCAIVTLGFGADEIGDSLSGTGFLTPFDRRGGLTGATWSSLKWTGRCPAEKLLVRLFFASGSDMDVETISEQALEKEALRALGNLVGCETSPSFCVVDRYVRALPIYELGHVERIERIERALEESNILLAGTSYHGVGIPDCVRQGREIVRKLGRVTIQS